MAKHYTIEGTTIYADILALNEKEEAEVNKFVKFGYTVVNKEEVKATVKRLDDDYILEYLAKLPEEKSKQALATYKGLKNEVAKDKDGKKKTTKNGNEKKRGFNAGRNWFARNYPDDTTEIEKAITEEGLMEKLKKAYPVYAKKCEKAIAEGSMKADDVMSEVEYKRDFYWKKVFVRK